MEKILTMQEMKMLSDDKELSKKIKKMSNEFFTNCSSNYERPQYDNELELSLDLKELKQHLYKILKNKKIKKISIKDHSVPIRIIKKLTTLTQLEEIELCNYKSELLLQKTLILFKKFKNLKILTIHTSDIKFVPKEIGKLKSLIDLSIYFTNIKSLPTEIGELKNLQRLHVPNDDLHMLPTSVINLKNLEEITMSSKLTNNQEQLQQNLPRLKSIYIMWNNFENLL